MGWWSSIDELKRTQTGAVEGALAEGDGASAPPCPTSSASMSMKHSREEMNIRRQGFINKLHYSVAVVAKTYNYRVTVMVAAVTEPVRRFQGESEQTTSTLRGSMYYNIDMANEKWVRCLGETLSALHSPNILRQAGFSRVDYRAIRSTMWTLGRSSKRWRISCWRL